MHAKADKLIGLRMNSIIDIGYVATDAKQYRNLFKLELDMQNERVEGFCDYIQDVKSGGCPGPGHTFKAPDGLIDGYLAVGDRSR
jgi:ketopantoate hydroxymethyltransferase